MDADEKIQSLEEFKKLINRFFESYDPEIRSEINRKKSWVKREVLEARCFKTFTVSPPPAVGGLVMRNVDAFEALFNPPYGMNVSSNVFDMIDEAIGVIMSGGPERPEPGPAVAEEPDYEERYAFIAMAIDPQNPELEDVLDSIKEAATKYGIHAERVDEVQSNNRISDRILESIQKAQFVIVDLTHSKPNVFYEAGYAQGLGKTPIYIARHGTRLEFDLKDYPVIFFRNMRELKDGLQERFRAFAEPA
jgi:hypothetical protein